MRRPGHGTLLALAPLVAALAASADPPPAQPAAQPADRATACIAAVAYAEAAGEGSAGIAAVVRVVRNRMTDPRFPKDACAVVTSPGEFQPVGDSRRLRAALTAPGVPDLVPALQDFGPVDQAILALAVRLAGTDQAAATPADPTGGALYFVNPRFMEPAKCPWFAALERTAAIGGHVFMTHYDQGEAARGPALDCAQVQKDWAAYLAASKGRRRVGRRINPAWLVPVDRSALAAGARCTAGTYDPVTRTYARAGC